MDAENEGLRLWYDTPEQVDGGPVTLTVGVAPPDGSNRVEVRYRINGGAPRTASAPWLRNDAAGEAQYFRAALPDCRSGDVVDYAAVCRCAGRQVPGAQDAELLGSTFQLAGSALDMPGTAETPPDATLPPPVQLSHCDEELPLSSITRQFDFGQFVFLHTKSDQQSGTPLEDKQPDTPVVVDPSGWRYEAYREWLDRLAKINLKKVGPRPLPKVIGPKGDPLGGVSLHKLVDGRKVTDWAPVEIVVDAVDLTKVVQTATVEHESRPLKLHLDAEMVASLNASGQTLALVSPEGGATQPFLTQLTVKLPTLNLDDSAVDHLLASGEVVMDDQVRKVALDATATRAVLDGQPVVAWAGGTVETLVRLEPPSTSQRVTAAEVVVEDLADFLVTPLIPGADGRPVSLALAETEVAELRLNGTATVAAGDERVMLVDGQRQTAATSNGMRMNRAYGDRFVLAAQSEARRAESETATIATISGTTAVSSSKLAPGAAMSPIGLPVAVFLPWRQTWELIGFSRGELRSSLALAPQEETTIEVSSWERRLRTLDQSSQTDVDQSFESVQTQRDTDDVFSEMTRRHDFSWQLEGSVDATYSTGNGSISVSAGGQVGDTSQLQSVARNTQQRLKESTQKSAARIRAVRTTRITDAIETGSQTRVTRQIKNTNYSHTLTLDFFETLAHYRVTLAARPDRLALVALLPNPMATKQFERDHVRRNETTLRRALLDPALADGFEACRKARAYEMAINVIAEQASMGAQTDDATDDVGKGTTIPETKPSPQAVALVELLGHIASAYRTVSTGADCVPALKRIPPNEPITDPERTNAQHWLFLRLCGKYLPGVIATIAAVPAAPTPAAAGPLVAVIPPPGSATTLANLNDKTDYEKEQTGLGPLIGDHVGRFNWNWSTGRCREESLYTSNDGGLAGLVDRLQRVYEAYLAKQAEGEMAAEKEVVISKANVQQDKLSTADKLAMAFPLDELAAAREREEALLAHLNQHPDHYSFALFQGLSPAEQSRYIETASGGSLEVGMFEPRVIAINGPQLAIPLAPPPAGKLRDFVETLRTSFTEAFGGTADTPDELLFPTPGLTINSRLGKCTTSEEYVEESRSADLRRLAAEAQLAELEARRREARIEAKDFDDPDVEIAPLRVSVDQPD